MSARLPSTRITPADVIAFCRKLGQKPTIKEAERWLSHQRKPIEEMMREVIEKNLEDILNQASNAAYPDPAFAQQYRVIDNAIVAATDDYAAKIGTELHSMSYTEIEMIEVVRRMLAHQEQFVACMAYKQEFTTPSKRGVDGKITHRTARVHITRKNGKVTAEIIENDRCDHGHDVFMPEKLHILH